MPLAYPPMHGSRTAEVIKDEEKGPDVNLASYLLLNALQAKRTGSPPIAVVVSNDSDLKLPVEAVQHEFGYSVGVSNPHLASQRSRTLHPTFFKQVGVHDLPDPAVGKAVPYGVYDVGANAAWVLVGADGETAAFAVQAPRRWWQSIGAAAYPKTDGLLLCADAGGSNGYRTRLWKTELAALADETGWTITACHFPPGTSKWNKIEHRVFSAITMNWRGRPLTSHEVVVELIGATRTKTGLRVRAELDRGSYPRGIKVSDS